MVKISNLDLGKVKPVCPFGNFKTIQDGPFLGGLCREEGVGGKKDPPFPKICHTSYNEETWHSYTLLEEDPKNT